MIDVKVACYHPINCRYNVYVLDRFNGELAWKFLENMKDVDEEGLTKQGIRIIPDLIDRDFFNNHYSTWRVFKEGDL